MTLSVDNHNNRLAYQRDYYYRNKKVIQKEWRASYALYRACGFHRVRRNGKAVWVTEDQLLTKVHQPHHYPQTRRQKENV